uniref:carboxypeptidase-like regulatory domain-containing protein n=1 Tax=Gelidibacter sp. TaxID=2018083 RepID=UPI0040494ACF
MRKVINIQIPEPCHEDWNTMTPQDKGRHCAVCSKTVVDFTKSTDEQIISTFEQSNKLCGRFKSNQLNRDVVFSRKERNNYLSLVASGLLAFLSIGNQDAQAQGQPKVVQIDSTELNFVKGKIATSVLKEKVITGTIISKEDQLPLPGVNVIIKGTTIGTQSDFDGNFTLKTSVDDILVISYLGFETIEIKVSRLKTYKVSLEMDETILGMMVTVGYPVYSESENVCSAEELERMQIKKERKENQLAFYKRKLKEEKALRKVKREQIRNGTIERTKTGKLLYNLSNIFRKK